MILVVDVGNSNIVIGVYQDKELKVHWRISTDRNKTEDEYGMLVKQLFDSCSVSLDKIDGAILSSVVPPLIYTLEKTIKKFFHLTPLVVGPGVRTGINIKLDNPKEVGADRIVNAVSAVNEYGTPLIIIDFGTATTFDYIDEKGSYQGGAIAPGIGISTEALYQRAAKLPKIELVKPNNVIGKNTIQAMQSGIIYGFAGQVDAIVERMMQQSDKRPKVVATGGLAKLIASESKHVDVVNPLLTLEGLRCIYMNNTKGTK